MEDIINSITAAEARAVEIKEQALKRAAEIAELAEVRAAEIVRKSEADCKAYREEKLKAAEEQARENYAKTLAANRNESAEYAAKCSKNSERQVSAIVGRITGGDR